MAIIILLSETCIPSVSALYSPACQCCMSAIRGDEARYDMHKYVLYASAHGLGQVEHIPRISEPFIPPARFDSTMIGEFRSPFFWAFYLPFIHPSYPICWPCLCSAFKLLASISVCGLQQGQCTAHMNTACKDSKHTLFRRR